MKKRMSLLLCALLLLNVFAFCASAQEEAPVKLSVMKATSQDIWDGNNPAVAKIMEVTNTQIDLQMVDDITTSLNLSMAAGTPCDIMVAPKFTYLDYIDTGYILELTDLLNEYGQNILNTISEDAWNYTKVGDQIYGIPYENFNSKYVTAIRKDWVENLGFAVKENYTLSELSEMLIAFTEKDPDGNGQNDTYGLNAYGGGWTKTLMAIYGAFGGQPDQYYQNEAGEFYAFNVSGDFRAALTYAHDLWAAGAIDPEFFVASGDQTTQKMVNSKAGYFSSWWSGPKALFEAGFAEINPSGDFLKIFVTSDDGKTQGMTDNGLINNVTLISSLCERPEKAMEFLNYIQGDEGYMLASYGMEGVHYELDEEGRVSNIFAQNRNWSPLAGIARRLDIVTFHDAVKIAEDSDLAAKTIYDFQMIQYETGLSLYTSVFYGLPSTTEVMEYGTELENFVTSKVVSFVTGETPLDDENWSEYKREWVGKGGQKILQSYADAYNALQGTNYPAASVE